MGFNIEKAFKNTLKQMGPRLSLGNFSGNMARQGKCCILYPYPKV